MSLITITYTDLEGVAPRVEFCGVTFVTGVPVSVDPGSDAGRRIQAKTAGNPWFRAGQPKPEPAPAPGRKPPDPKPEPAPASGQ